MNIYKFFLQSRKQKVSTIKAFSTKIENFLLFVCDLLIHSFKHSNECEWKRGEITRKLRGDINMSGRRSFRQFE